MAETPKPVEMSREQRILRDKICCSAPWADAVLAEMRAGKTLTEFYPPGGKAETKMRICRDCDRWCPPNDSASRSCCDCESDLGFQRLSASERQDLWQELRKLWWPRSQSYREHAGRVLGLWRAVTAVLASSDQAEHWKRLLEEACECDVIEQPQTAAGAKVIGIRKPYRPAEWDFGEEAPRKRADTAIHLKIANRALRRLRGDSRRHISIGCDLPILPEDDSSLQKEIAYYIKNKPIVLPDADAFRAEKIHLFWIKLGVIPSATDVRYSLRTHSRRY